MVGILSKDQNTEKGKLLLYQQKTVKTLLERIRKHPLVAVGILTGSKEHQRRKSSDGAVT